MAKQVYSWGKVRAGDIVSFRYKGKKPSGTLTTLLVFNPKLPYTKKDGTKTFHLVGLKLEDRGTIPVIKSKPVLAQFLERVGNVRVVSGEDQIYKVLISGTGSRGARKSTYTRLKQHIEKHSVYKEAKRSRVFLEPIVLPKEFREVLVEN